MDFMVFQCSGRYLQVKLAILMSYTVIDSLSLSWTIQISTLQQTTIPFETTQSGTIPSPVSD